MHPFVLGQEYERTQLLEFIGSKQLQSGVLWGSREPGCLIITSGGRHGKKVGYSDHALTNGCWWYFGQGQKGDHDTTNAANKRLIEGLQSVLLFSTRELTAGEVRQRGSYKKLFAFQGEFNVSDHEIVVPESGARQGNKLLCFLLVPVDGEGFHSGETIGNTSTNLVSLRQELIDQSQPHKHLAKVTLAEYRQRSNKVRRYALLRANGKCEACGCPAPFVDGQGNGFLEVHHILRLADDGIDAPRNVAAICPNCHRRAHYSADRESFRQHLLISVFHSENELGE